MAKQKPTNELQWKYTKDQNRATGKLGEWRIYNRPPEYLYHVYLNDVLQLHACSRYLPEAKCRVPWIEDGRWERWEDIVAREGDTKETKAKYLKVQKLPEPLLQWEPGGLYWHASGKGIVATGKRGRWWMRKHTPPNDFEHVFLNDELQVHACSEERRESMRRIQWIESGRWEAWEDIVAREGDTKETERKYVRLMKLPEPQEVETVQDNIESLIGNLEVDQVAATERHKGSSGQRATGLIGLLRRMFG